MGPRELAQWLGKTFRWGWGRAGDVSLLQWVFPTTFSKIITTVATVGTAVIGLLTDAPPVLWIPVAAAVAIFVLVIVHLWRGLRRSERLVIRHGPRKPLHGSSQSLVPDWPIRCLFFHICPDILATDGDDKWEPVGNDVLDKLTSEQLKAWGRRIDRSGPTRFLPLSPIEATYWETAYFSFVFLLDDHEEDRHVSQTRHMGLPDYGGLMVNRAQAEAIWSPAPDETEPRRISVFELIKVAENSHGWKIAGSRVHLQLLADGIRQAVIDRDFELFGRQQGGAVQAGAVPLIKVDPDHLIRNTISVWEAWIKELGHYVKTSPSDASEPKDALYYIDLHLSRRQGLSWLRGPVARAIRDRADSAR